MAYVILDGKIFSADRYSEKTTRVKGTQIDLWCSGKADEHGGNVQALSAPDGFPLWVADVEPGCVHDLTVARDHVLGAWYWAASHLGLAHPRRRRLRRVRDPACTSQSNNPPVARSSPPTTGLQCLAARTTPPGRIRKCSALFPVYDRVVREGVAAAEQRLGVPVAVVSPRPDAGRCSGEVLADAGGIKGISLLRCNRPRSRHGGHSWVADQVTPFRVSRAAGSLARTHPSRG